MKGIGLAVPLILINFSWGRGDGYLDAKK